MASGRTGQMATPEGPHPHRKCEEFVLGRNAPRVELWQCRGYIGPGCDRVFRSSRPSPAGMTCQSTTGHPACNCGSNWSHGLAVEKNRVKAAVEDGRWKRPRAAMMRQQAPGWRYVEAARNSSGSPAERQIGWGHGSEGWIQPWPLAVKKNCGTKGLVDPPAVPGRATATVVARRSMRGMGRCGHERPASPSRMALTLPTMGARKWRGPGRDKGRGRGPVDLSRLHGPPARWGPGPARPCSTFGHASLPGGRKQVPCRHGQDRQGLAVHDHVFDLDAEGGKEGFGLAHMFRLPVFRRSIRLRKVSTTRK